MAWEVFEKSDHCGEERGSGVDGVKEKDTRRV